jgi:maltose O-acetyltransferase
VTILAGVHIHEKTVVGAGSVVLHDLPNNSLCAGVPAKQLKTLKLP